MDARQKNNLARTETTVFAYTDGQKAGRRKAKVQELFQSRGADAAWVLGLRLKLKEGTLRKWFADWHAASKAGSQR